MRTLGPGMLRRALRGAVPPALRSSLHTIYRRLHRARVRESAYTSWTEALAGTTGYDTPSILREVERAALCVKRGEAAFERDSVLFAHHEYNWPLIGALLSIALRAKGRLDVVDFGGSLGSAYFQHRPLLSCVDLTWSVVEQPHFVAVGNASIGDEHLTFHDTIDRALGTRTPQVIVLSGVLQYIEDWSGVLEDILERDFQFIIVDRTAFIDKHPHRITVQRVPSDIYDASYPAWFFNKAAFRKYFEAKYDLLAEYEPCPRYTKDLGDEIGYHSGLFYERKRVDTRLRSSVNVVPS